MSLKGTCNQCGNCCTLGPYVCANLDVKAPIGTPLATRCLVYNRRSNDMPIVLVNYKTGDAFNGYCLHGSKAEEMALTDLVRQGKCSLEIDNGEEKEIRIFVP